MTERKLNGRGLFIVILGAAFAAAAPVACGDDGDGISPAQRMELCEVSCGKLNECNALFGLTVEQCEDLCNDGNNSGGTGSNCEPSNSEVNACIDAYRAAECSALTMGMTPPECDVCPDNGSASGSADASATMSASGASASASASASATQGDASGTATADGGGAGCSELSSCCGNLADQMSIDACTMTVDSGNDSLCGQLLAGFQATGMC